MPSKPQATYHYELPSKAEIEQTLLVIGQYKDEIHDYTVRIKELQSLADESSNEEVKRDFDNVIEQLTGEMEGVTVKLSKKEAFISPIRRLPTEMIAEILMCHVLANGCLPWGVLAVCRSWRYVGLGTPRLWSRVHITTNEQILQLKRSYSGSFPRGIPCGDCERLETILTRSGAVLLDVSMDIGSYLQEEMVDLICNQAGQRWRSIDWNIVPPGDLPKRWINDSTQLPNLRIATFSSRYYDRLTEEILSKLQTTSPQLRALSFQSKEVIPRLTSKTILLQRLRHLDWQASISLNVYTPNFLSTMGLGGVSHKIWPYLSKLETLVLREEAVSPFEKRREGDFELLTTLAVARSHLEGLQPCARHLRSLAYVYLEGISQYRLGETLEPFSISLENVTHFTLVNDTYQPLSFFHLPSLVSLEIYGNNLTKNDANDDLEVIWNPDTFGKAPCPSLVLHMEPKANDAYILAALRLMGDLKELHLYYDTPPAIDSKLMTALAVAPKPRIIAKGPNEVKKWKAPLCPGLEGLTIVCKRGAAKDRENCLAALTKIYEVRAGTGSEMKVPELVSASANTGCGSRNKAARLMENWVEHYDDA